MIGHIDADCFYVSCERVRFPALLGKPVGVLGNQGACVIAKSYEAKAAGIGTGQPIWEAIELCPELICVKRDFRWYEVLSTGLLKILKERFDRVEYYSIDEMFFEIKKPDEASLLKLQQDILTRLRIPVTIGVAPTRTLAKLVSDQAKPFGCRAIVSKPQVESVLHEYGVEDITGIAARRAKRLHAFGIFTCWDYAHADPKLILSELTVVGEQIWTELNGSPSFPLREERPLHKCLSRGGSIGKATASPEIVWAWTIRNIERLIEVLDKHQLLTKRFLMQVQQQMDYGWSDQVVFPVETASFGEFVEAARQMFVRHPSPIPVVRMHLLADQLVRKRDRQISLFELPNPKQERAAEAKQQINDRHGRFAVRSGETLFLPELYQDSAHSYDICDVEGKMCF